MPRFPTIDGATPIDDASGLKLGITTLPELYEAEASNIAHAVVKYLANKPSKRSAPFSAEWALKLHKEMFEEVWNWAGQIRTSGTTNVGVQPHRIREELYKLFADLEAWGHSGMDLVEQAVRLHHRAVWIHPFPNGNGRWSRMLADIWLKQHGHAVAAWPSDMNRESPIRAEYIQAVREADNGNLEPLLTLEPV